MKRLVLFLAVIGILLVRRRMFEHSDREQGFGAYADVAPPALS